MANFVDANVIVYAYTENDKKSVCRDYLLKGNLIVNVLVLVESFNKVSQITKDVSIAIDMLKVLYKSENIAVVDVDINLLFESLKRVKSCKLKIADLIHYTTALLNDCKSIVSYDKDFNNLLIPREEP